MSVRKLKKDIRKLSIAWTKKIKISDKSTLSRTHTQQLTKTKTNEIEF